MNRKVRVSVEKFRVEKFTIKYAIYGPERLPVDERDLETRFLNSKLKLFAPI